MQEFDESKIRFRILIADDHSIVAEGLRDLLEKRYNVIGIVPRRPRVRMSGDSV